MTITHILITHCLLRTHLADTRAPFRVYAQSIDATPLATAVARGRG